MSLGRLCNVTNDNCNDKKIMVSISMLVYNHERWLAKAIESVLMQKTNFRYELIIAEDCSTDKSKDIVERYATAYPHIIRAYYNSSNLGMDLNDHRNEDRVRGKYYAILEGDDYWTDPNKLQIQVDFLEKNPEYSGCYHSVCVVDENENPISVDTKGFVFNNDSDVDQDNWANCPLPGQAGSMVMRNLFSKLSPDMMKVYRSPRCNGDLPIPILMLRYGKIRRMGREMSCYRRTYTGDSYHARMMGKDLRFIDYFQYLERDKLAEKFWNKSYFPHYESLELLECILGDSERNIPGSNEKLARMAAYDIGQFLAFMAVYDCRLIALGLEGRLYRRKEFTETINIRECVLFGTGDFGERIYNLLKKNNTEIVEVWDNSEQKKIFHGIKVLKPHFRINTELIILATKDYIDEMCKQMDSLGYVRGKDYLTIIELRQKRYLSTLNQKVFKEL